MSRLIFAGLLMLTIFGFVGCASQGRRVPVDVEPVLTHDFNPTDLQIVTDQTVKTMLAKPDALPSDRRPMVYVAKVRNLTDEHMNGEIIVERIAYLLSESGRVRLTDPKTQDESIKQLEFQQGAFVDPTTTKKIGKMIGADYFVQGELTNMQSKAGWRKGQYFQFTLTLANIETNEVWKSQVPIQKLSKRGWFGW